MLRVIKEFQPTWIIGENVAGILSMAQYEGDAKVGSQTDLFGNTKDIHSHEGRGILYGIIEQLGEIGYAVQTFVIPACAVNAPHRRDRVWIVANRTGDRLKWGRTGIAIEEGLQPRSEPAGELAGGLKRPHSDAPDTTGIGQELKASERKLAGERYAEQNSWDRNWLEVATQLCGMDDGLPAELDGFKLSKAGHRVERLKSLGNAIVPAVAIEIMKAINSAEQGKI
jgi:DNA (cytosine-5)-methyltransferase 1